MDPILLVGGGAVLAVASFVAGFLVASHNAKQAASIIQAVNTAKDAVTAHTTATAQQPPAPPAA